VRNWFGGNSRLSTELLDGLHYRGRLDVVRRDRGTRVYRLAADWRPHDDPQAAMDRMADALVQKYAPLPAASLSQLINMLFHAAYQ
ncbi:crosslink repair DNA glycosylase YcaQ family protein, partial [Acinetobacter baumannii]